MILQPLTGVEGFDRLVSLKTTTANDEDDLSYPDYKDTRDAEARADAKTFEGLAAFSIRRLNLRTSPAAEARLAEPMWGVLASANYFDVLGVRPMVGRGFVPGEDAVERGAPVVVISHALWQRRFGGRRRSDRPPGLDPGPRHDDRRRRAARLLRHDLAPRDGSLDSGDDAAGGRGQSVSARRAWRAVAGRVRAPRPGRHARDGARLRAGVRRPAGGELRGRSRHRTDRARARRRPRAIGWRRSSR